MRLARLRMWSPGQGTRRLSGVDRVVWYAGCRDPSCYGRRIRQKKSEQAAMRSLRNVSCVECASATATASIDIANVSAPVETSTLGPLLVEVDGADIVPSGRQPKALLALLVARPNQFVSRYEL